MIFDTVLEFLFLLLLTALLIAFTFSLFNKPHLGIYVMGVILISMGVWRLSNQGWTLLISGALLLIPPLIECLRKPAESKECSTQT